MVLFILSLLFVFVIPSSTALVDSSKIELTRQRLKALDAAFVNYVAVNKRLPCPASGALDPSVPADLANMGVEGARDASGDCTLQQASGVVPYVALGLSEADSLDGWENRITYRAGYGLTRTSALDMTYCDPAGTKGAADTSGTPPPGGSCYATCISGAAMTECSSSKDYLASKGFYVKDGGGNNIMDPSSYMGAAYLAISHGRNTYGAYTSKGTLIATPRIEVLGINALKGTSEEFNINGPTKTIDATTPTTANTFRDAAYSEGSVEAVYFDDLILRPSVIALIQKANLGPRSH